MKGLSIKYQSEKNNSEEIFNISFMDKLSNVNGKYYKVFGYDKENFLEIFDKNSTTIME